MPRPSQSYSHKWRETITRRGCTYHLTEVFRTLDKTSLHKQNLKRHGYNVRILGRGTKRLRAHPACGNHERYATNGKPFEMGYDTIKS